MNRKLKLVLAALLGFSAACSSVKNTPRQGEDQQKREAGADSAKGDTIRRIIAMYGVRMPTGSVVVSPKSEVPKSQIPELDPVAEKAED